MTEGDVDLSTTKRPTGRSTKKKVEAAAPKARTPKRAAAPAAPAPKAAAKPAKAAKPPKPVKVAKPPPPPIAPPQVYYDLSGPVPPEGAGLPAKVGALLGVGQKALGIKSFRAGQAQAFEQLLAGQDVLAVMPTGSGKSLLYQLPSVILPGITVVVSPLIALIKDQIDKMVAKGVTAVRIDSTLTVKQRREVDALIRAPGGKLLLTTPERMADPEFRVFLREAASGVGVSRFVVDEAHCVSQWGHDFRPAYLSLRKALDDVGRPPVLATTATAPPHVRDDILFQLGIEDAKIVTTTFDRPNLHYEVIPFDDDDEKMRTLVTLLKKLPKPGIVYAATVKKVEELYESLTRHGIAVERYHGRMNKGERDASQNKFMASSELIMIATNAFGLGVDKPDIRNVLHYHVPGSLEAYAQEAGRGGRDGKPARCVLLFSPDDVAIQEYFLSGTYPTKRQVWQVFKALEAFTALRGKEADESPPTVTNLALGSSVGQQRTRTVLSLLKDEHFITEKEGGLYYVADPPPEIPELMERARQYEARRIADRQRLDSLLAYVKAPGCRSIAILEYLGEIAPQKCGRCDNCLR
ncbi:MAG TPA: ATP-dependent DNA helicase RecQ, partial [Kofleriaceae bacterium]